MTTHVRIEIADVSGETSVATTTAADSAIESFNGGADSAAVASSTEPADTAAGMAYNGGAAPDMAAPVPAGTDMTAASSAETKQMAVHPPTQIESSGRPGNGQPQF